MRHLAAADAQISQVMVAHAAQLGFAQALMGAGQVLAGTGQAQQFQQ